MPDSGAHADADTNAHSLSGADAAAGHDLLNAGLAIALVALFYGVSAFALTTFVDDGRTATASGTLGRRQVAQMLVCIGCAAIGAFAQARGVTPERLVVSAVAVSALAGVALDPRFRSRLSIYAVAAAVSVVLVSAVFSSMWSAVVSAGVVALPFLVTACVVRERAASACDALLAALTGATIGVTGAVLVLFVAGLWALAAGTVRKQPGSRRTLATVTAALTLAAIFYNFSVGS